MHHPDRPLPQLVRILLRPPPRTTCGCHAPSSFPRSGAPADPRPIQSLTRHTAGRTRIHVEPAHAANPPKICRQTTATFPPEAFGRFGQALRYGTPQWHGSYALLRNAIEGGNGHLKEASGPAIGDPGRRRIRGIAAQSVFVALGIFSLNLQRITSFLENCEVGTDGVIRTRAKEAVRVRRITESLQVHAPTLPTGDPPKVT